MGDNAGADMCRPFRWVAIVWPVCLMNPSVGGRFFRGVSRVLQLLPCPFASIYRPVMPWVTPREGRQQSNAGSLSAYR